MVEYTCIRLGEDLESFHRAERYVTLASAARQPSEVRATRCEETDMAPQRQARRSRMPRVLARRTMRRDRASRSSNAAPRAVTE